MSLLRRIASRLAQRSYEDESMDAAGANAPDAEQSLADGTKVLFDLRDHDAVEFDPQSDLATQYDGTVGIIDCLATATEMGQQDFEYYDIRFPDGQVLEAVSGLHLTPVRTNKWKWKGGSLRTALTTWEGIKHKQPEFIVPEVGDTVKHPSGLQGVVTRVMEKSVQVKVPGPVYADQWDDLNASRIHSNPYLLDIYAGDGFLYDAHPWRVVRNTWVWKGAQLNNAVDEALAYWLENSICSVPEFTKVIGELTQDPAIVKLAILAWLANIWETEEDFRNFLTYIAAGDVGRLSTLSRGGEPNTWKWKGPSDSTLQDNS